jgi:hypothetical protein
MKTIILLILSAFTAFAATLYPVMTDNANRTFAGGGTNLALLNATNRFTGPLQLPSVTAGRVPIIDAGGNLTNSAVTPTTLAFLDATSSLQTQMDSKLPLAGGTMSGAISFGSSSSILKSDNSFPWILRTVADANIAYIESSGKMTLNGGLAINGTITGASSMTLGASGSYRGDFFSDITGTTKAYFQTSASGYGWLLVNRVTSDVNLAIRAVGSQTASLTEWQNSAGTVVAKVSNTGALTIGSAGTAVTNYVSATATLDFGSINSLASEDLTITVTGAVANDTVTLGLPAAPTAGIIFQAFVSAANTVTVRAHNYTAGAIDPAAATYRVGVTSH